MNQAVSIIERPELTLPEREATVLRARYAQADVILEYGVGGSTVMAAEMAGKNITSIETDQDWVAMINAWFAKEPCQSVPDVIWANIGETVHWGRPKDDSHWKDYAKYALSFWNLDEMAHPDVVFVDGRFRAACVLAAAFNCKRKTRVLVDDYARRESYHAVEKFVDAPRLIGRMAEFEITPTPIPAEHLLEIITLMQDPY
ncbi:hypothetical protein [Planktotalea sp.]|uniref:hypothetical protein n=1 Tax=Planktotalea sp. TaxID=2029877 RepID=UPI0032993E02